MTQVCAALLSGNVVVLKTSNSARHEPTHFEIMDRYNLAVPSTTKVPVVDGARLAAHPDLDALLFSGSHRTAQKVGALLGKRPELPVMLQTGARDVRSLLRAVTWIEPSMKPAYLPS